MNKTKQVALCMMVLLLISLFFLGVIASQENNKTGVAQMAKISKDTYATRGADVSFLFVLAFIAIGVCATYAVNYIKHKHLN
jgi:hypothetical protein